MGSIAYWHVGKIPIHADDDNPWLLHDSSDVAKRHGFIPLEQVPPAINPE